MNIRKAKRQYQKVEKKKKSKVTKIQNEYFSTYKKKVGSPILWEYVFPIYTCSKQEDKVELNNIAGTCFHIGNGLFLTAAHVINYNSKYSNHLQMGFLNQVSNGCVATYDIEIVEEFIDKDIALVKCDEILVPDKKPKIFHWHHRSLQYYDIIRAMGYPSGYDKEKGFTNPRAFQGTKVGNVYYEHDDVKANCYEVSFHCLRGLSGTCLIDQGYQIHGLIIGNNKEEINFFDEIEEETKETAAKKERYVFMKSETSYIGLAIDKTDIFELQSTYLGKTIHEYLIENKLHRCNCT